MKKYKSSFQEENGMPGDQLTREARLQIIRKAITAGTYRIDSGKLADSLLNDLLHEQWLRIRLQGGNF